MPSFRTSHVVKHKPQQMFDLVADVESYPQFVPLCQSLKIRRRFAGPSGAEEGGAENGGAETLLADMEVGYRAIKERFTSRVKLDRAARRIEVEYVDGPFSHMENTWIFTDAGDGCCRVEFFIAYEFRNRTLAALMGHMFDAAFRKFASAFEARADKVFRAA